MRKLDYVRIFLVLALPLLSSDIISQTYLPKPAASGQWTLQNPESISTPLEAVWTFNSQKAIVIGMNSKVIMTEDSGDSWTTIDFPDSQHLINIFFSSDTTGWIRCYSSIYKTTDGGMSWIKTEMPFKQTSIDEHIIDLFFINETVGWMVYYDSVDTELWQTTDGGENWVNIYQFFNELEYVNISFIDEQTGFAANDGLYKTADGGQSWEMILGREIKALHFFDTNTGIVLDRSGFVLKTTDGGEHWETYQVNGSGWEIHFTDELNGVVLGASIYATDDGGVSWERVYTPGNHILSMHIAEDGAGYAVGDYGQILQTSDGGKTWAQNTKGYFNNLNAIDFINRNTGWACGDNIILHTTDGGTTWSEQYCESYVGGIDIDFTGENHGWIAGESSAGAALFHTTDGGEHWEVINFAEAPPLMSIQFVNVRIGYACGYGMNGYIIKTSDGGNNWQLLNCEDWDFLKNLCFVDENNGWLSSGGTILHTTDGGSTWDYQDLSYGIRCLQFIDKYTGWFGYDTHGDMRMTTDGGKSWYFQELPTTHSRIFAFDFVDPLNGWACALYGYYETHDGGHTWEYSGGSEFWPIGGASFDICFLDESVGWAIGQGGRIIRYDSDSAAQDPRYSGRSILMRQNYPNPFNNATTIRYELLTEGHVNVDIYNIQGQLVETLADEWQGKGVHFYTWSPINVASGIYFCRVSTSQEQKTIKIIFLK
ncbi:YCF48-related protein [candidate division KSB1 bacterium]